MERRNERRQRTVLLCARERRSRLTCNGGGGRNARWPRLCRGRRARLRRKTICKAHKTDADVAGYLANERLYELPSTRDAFTEFCQLSQEKGKTVDGDAVGYGISPSPTTLSQRGKTKYFTAQNVAMLVDEYNSMRSTFFATLNVNEVEWGVAPLYQWRAYDENGDVLEKNGTPVVGKEAGHSLTNCLAVPRRVKSEKRKQLAFAVFRRCKSIGNEYYVKRIQSKRKVHGKITGANLCERIRLQH